MTDEFTMEFVEEARELLDNAEPLLIELSDDEAGKEVDFESINSIFRLFHSIKGGAGYLNFNHLVAVTHEAEALLDIFRNGDCPVESQHIQVLLKAADFLRHVLDGILESGTDEAAAEQAPEFVEKIQKMKASALGEEVSETTDTTPPENSSKENTCSEETPAPELPKEMTPLQGGLTANGVISISEMIQPFIAESDELLLTAEELVHKVRDADPAATMGMIDEVYRNIHSLKGNCGFLGFADGERVGHALENALDLVREEKISPDEEFISTALFCIEGLRSMVENIAKGGDGSIAAVDAYTDLIRDTVSGDTVAVEVDDQGTADTGDNSAVADNGEVKEVQEVQEAEVAHADGPNADPEIAEETQQPEGEPTMVANSPVSTPEAEVSSQATTPEPETTTPVEPANSEKPAAKTEIKKATTQRKELPQTEDKSKKASIIKRQDIRVDIGKLDSLIDLVGELVTAEVMVTENPDIKEIDQEMERFDTAVHHLRRIIADLQDVAMSVRMVPLEMTLKRMLRLTHDVSSKLGKKVRLELIGAETEVDKTVVETIVDPLVHIVRNSIDHGLEMPAEREAAGKDPTGTLTIEAGHMSGEVAIMIRDDGKGLDRDMILSKAIERGIVHGDGSDLTDEKVFALIFEPGFSTAASVTDVSGRGVGMDVVKRNIEKLHGRIDLASTKGEGTTVTLRIPLTMAIMDGMLVRVGNTSFTIPIFNIRESLKPTQAMITTTMEGEEVVMIREELIPVVRLYSVFEKKPDSENLEDGLLVVIESRGISYAMLVDEVLGQQQAVVKPVPIYLGSMRGISGCTILGDGHISLIVDVAGLMDLIEAEDDHLAPTR